MIKIRNLTKRFNNRTLFENINLDLPDKGMVCICGRSGEGKSTLLHILSAIEKDYDGSLYFNNQNYEEVRDIEKFRFENFGFVFQNYALFELLNVQDNIIFDEDTTYSNNIKLTQMLKKVNLPVSPYQSVNTLSGGEKQKVAISRALFHRPKVLFCDEVTASLDSNSKMDIINVLKNISKEILVVIVTHEMNLVNDVADAIYELKNKKIITLKNCLSIIKKDSLKFEKRINKLSFKLMIKYVFSHLKAKKKRTFMAYFAIGLGLLCIGISLIIPSIAKMSIETELMSQFDENKILVKEVENQNDEINEIYSAPLGVLEDLKDKYKNVVKGIGTFYFSSFESQFQTKNYLECLSSKDSLIFTEINARSINEYLWFEELPTREIRPKINNLKNDEFVFLLRNRDIKKLCEGLNLPSVDANALEQYLLSDSIEFRFCFGNSDWSYEDEFFVECVGFIEADEIGIAHSSHFWNEYFFEERMRMKSDDDLISSNYIPWTFKKTYFLKIDERYQINFLKTLWKDEEYQDFHFDFIDGSNAYYLCKNNAKTGRIYVTTQDKKRMNITKIENLLDSNKINNYFFGVDKTYYVMEELLLNGFSSSTFLLKEEKDVVSIIDQYSITEENINMVPNIKYNNPFLYGGLGVIADDESLKITSKESVKSLYGRQAMNYNEIVISKRIVNNLFGDVNLEIVAAKEVYFLTIKESIYDGNHYQNNFVYTKLKIVGIDEQNNEWNNLYVDPYWPMLFYIDNFSYAASDLTGSCCVIGFNSSEEKSEYLNKWNQENPELKFLNPIEDISKSIDEIIFYIDIGLLSFSGIAIISAILMNLVMIYLFINDSRYEIGIMRILGIDKKNILTLFILFSLIIGMGAFLYAILLLGLAMIFLSFEMSIGFNFQLIQSFFKTDLIILIIAIVVSVFIGVVSSSTALKTKPLDVLRYK